MAKIDESGDLADYINQYFGGGDQSGPRFGITDPPVRYQGPDIPAGPTGGGNPNPTNIAATPDWLKQTLNSGVSAEEAARTYNTVFGRTSGNEAVVYPNTNGGGHTTIGIPEGYFTQEGGKLIGPGLNEWGFTERGPGGGTGGGNPPPATQDKTGFADPAYQQLLDLANKRINTLGQPVSFPQFDAYMAQLNQEKQLARQRAQTFADQLTARIGELNKPLMSTQDAALTRAGFQNQTQAERDRALAANQERLALRGFDPRTSGLLEGSNRATNAAYDARTGNIDATLAAQAIAQDEQRKNQATRLQQLAYQALQGGDLGSLQAAASAMDAERNAFDLEQSRQREQLSTAGIPVELTNTGLDNALKVLGGGGGSGSALSSLFGALGLGQQQSQIDSANTSALFGGIGQWLNTILQAAGRF